ncbi:MAG: hypothetical protein LBF86_04700 [Helicobacteraceae bacterium]|jgi:hypothetical protein|nr:hypothetical protein [Helicobacteraceae bacterium]
MKRYLLPLALAMIACAEPIVVAETIEIKESPNKNGYYAIAPQTPNAQSTDSVKSNRYYKNGDPQQEYVSTGSVIVSFSVAKSQSEIEAFAAKWKLSNAKQINEMFHTWAFNNISSYDDLTLASKIGQEESDISFAKPDFIAKIKTM